MTEERKLNDTGMLKWLKIAEMYGDQIRMTWQDAQKRGMKDPVVFVLDCRDQIGGMIAWGILGPEMVEGVITRSEENEIDDAVLMLC